MSSATDLVFVTKETEWDSDQGVGRCPQFEDMVKRYGYRCEPASDCGTKNTSTAVYFVGGVNYLSDELVEEIKAADWPVGTVLYTHFEWADVPDVMVFGKVAAEYGQLMSGGGVHVRVIVVEDWEEVTEP